MNIFKRFRDDLLESIEALQEKGELPRKLDLTTISVEPPRNPDHGDISTNAALVLAGVAKIILEFVSANPTGPLHVGHARGAIFGDTLARLLGFAGYEVVREYYWNDAGTQVDNLAKATYWRYLKALGLSMSPSLPNGDAEIEYKGDYLEPVGEELAKLSGNLYVDMPEAEWLPVVKSHSVEAMKAVIREDLELLDVRFDSEVSEENLLADGKVDAVIAA